MLQLAYSFLISAWICLILIKMLRKKLIWFQLCSPILIHMPIFHWKMRSKNAMMAFVLINTHFYLTIFKVDPRYHGMFQILPGSLLGSGIWADILLYTHVIGPKIHGSLQMLQRNIFDIFTHDDASSHCQMLCFLSFLSGTRFTESHLFDTWSFPFRDMESCRFLGQHFRLCIQWAFALRSTTGEIPYLFMAPSRYPESWKFSGEYFLHVPLNRDLDNMYRSGKKECCHCLCFRIILTTRLHYWNNIFYGIKALLSV